MATVTQGNKNTVNGKIVDDGCKDHREATLAARERAGAGGTTSVALKPTVGVQIFFGFSDAEWYVKSVSPEKSTADALRAAVEQGLDDEALVAASGRGGAKHAKGKILWAQAIQLTEEALDADGDRHPPGSWIVRMEVSGRPEIFTDENFGKEFRTPTASESKVHDESMDKSAAQDEQEKRELAAASARREAAAADPLAAREKALAAREKEVALREKAVPTKPTKPTSEDVSTGGTN